MKKFAITTVLISSFLLGSTANASFFDDIKNAIADGLDTPKQNLKAYAAVEDKVLVDSLFKISEDGSEQGINSEILKEKTFTLVKVNSQSFVVKNYFLKGTMASIRDHMDSYAYDPLDVLGKTYVQMANIRGNTVKQFKPALGTALNRLVEKNLMFKPAPNVMTWITVDNVLAEYAPGDRLVSFMTRSHQAVDQLGATSDQYTHFYFGKPMMMAIENRISNKLFEDNFQRVVSLN